MGRAEVHQRSDQHGNIIYAAIEGGESGAENSNSRVLVSLLSYDRVRKKTTSGTDWVSDDRVRCSGVAKKSGSLKAGLECQYVLLDCRETVASGLIYNHRVLFDRRPPEREHLPKTQGGICLCC